MKRWAGLLLLFALRVSAQGYRTPEAPLLGSAWYPEQWPEAAWDKDLGLMEAAHFNVVRMGEFAWSSLEPREGQFTLDWLDRAIKLAARHHLKVVLGTPTDAPPAWLTTRYPETRGTDGDGHLREHGGRRQFNYANPHYRQLCAAIVAQMARRFGHDPTVLGWQIGNEYTDESFDADTTRQWQAYLHARFETLAELNRHWSTSYSDWARIPLLSTSQNPGLLLEHKHFVTATWRSFQQVQIDTLRPLILPGQFITTNIGGLAWSDNWDHYAMTAPLDLASWDEYVGSGHLDVLKEAMLNDFVRGWKRQNFWVMETQPATVNWSPLNNALSPGETRALAWQAVGHGADAILYWQWRPALNGQEQYHGSVVGPDGEPNPIYAELQQLGTDFAQARVALAGTSPHAEIALLHAYDSRWAIDFQPFTKAWDQQQVMLRFYQPLSRMASAHGQAVDIVDPSDAPLDRYKLLVAPGLNVLSDALAAKLLAYVRGGGHLVLGPRSGMKDEYNALRPERQPGPLAAALGAQVAQFYSLESSVAPAAPAQSGPIGQASVWAEALTTAPGTTVDLFYVADPPSWLAGKAALVTRAVGKGTLSYLGTLQDEFTLRRFFDSLTGESTGPIPSHVETCTRAGLHGSVTILINHGGLPASVTLDRPMRSVLGPRAMVRVVQLQPQGVAVLEEVP